jgi:hypothetical protein
MTDVSPFGSRPDPRLTEALKHHFEGPDPMAAVFLLGASLWSKWWQDDEVPTPISVAILEAPRPFDVNPVMHAVLEEDR